MAKVKSKTSTHPARGRRARTALHPDKNSERRSGAPRVAFMQPPLWLGHLQPNRLRIPPRPGTKQALIVSLLAREAGASLDELVSATRWLPHTARAALTRLRQSGYAILRSKDEAGRTRYRIEAARPAPRARKAA